MKRPSFTELKRTFDKISLRELNNNMRMVRALTRSGGAGSFSSNAGLYLRRPALKGGINVTKEVIAVKNQSGGGLLGNRFIFLSSYDPDNSNYITNGYPPDIVENTLAHVAPGQLAILRTYIANGVIGEAYIRGIHKVVLYNESVEDIQAGDPCGVRGTTGTLGKLGPFTCLKVASGYGWIVWD